MKSAHERTRGLTRRPRWGHVLLGSVFFAAGLAVSLAIVVPALIDAVQMRGWIEARATLDSVERVRNDGSTRVEARYRYVVDGNSYTGTRVGVHGGSDNLGDFQETLGNRLARARETNEPVVAWFDPDDPARAVLDKSVRPGLLIFLSLFAVVFGGVGALVAATGWRTRPVVDDTAFATRPWQQRKAWNGGTLTSQARTSALTFAGFAAFWNLLSWTMLILAYESLLEEGVAVLAIMLLFPLAGIGLAAFAVRAVREWRRHGATPLSLEPFPGVLGGPVAGDIVLGSSVPIGTPVTMTLSAVRHYRSGKNSREEVRDQWTQAVAAEAGLDGPTARFFIEAPSGFPPSDASHARVRNAWYLAVDAEDIGLSRRFEVPVYPDTGSHTGVARRIDARKTLPSSDQSWFDPLPVVVTDDLQTIEWHYGLFYRKVVVAIGSVVAASFVAIAAHISRDDTADSLLFAALFGGFSALVLIAFVAALGSSKRVRFSPEGLAVRHWWFGLPVRRCDLEMSAIERFACERSGSESGQSGPVIFYRVVAYALDRTKVAVAWRIKGKVAAQAAVAGLEDYRRRLVFDTR